MDNKYRISVMDSETGARADKEIDDAPDILTPEERAMSRALDVLTKAVIDGDGDGKPLGILNGRGDKQERREYQKDYGAAHREKIRAKRRARYAARKAAGKGKEGNNGRKI